VLIFFLNAGYVNHFKKPDKLKSVKEYEEFHLICITKPFEGESLMKTPWNYHLSILSVILLAIFATNQAAICGGLKESVYRVGKLKPVDSILKVKVGEEAPDFTLTGTNGERITLSQYLGKKNVVLTFVPAAWTPVCSEQWPDFNKGEDLIKNNDSILLGITTDNIPTLYAWTKQMGGVWFPVLSDFWPHGAVARRYGVLPSERAIFIIDKDGIIQYIDVHDINKPPLLVTVILELSKLGKRSQ
jgi:peroxiredoxin